ncbi:MAG: aminotransferase class V-fold PLP-dependent enzyme [Holophagales bacterium]|nr:MAG: aminotransferase class V-fold PLP-dependent enzyme [Holophagales bacterium]
MQDSDLVLPAPLASRDAGGRELLEWLDATIHEARELVRLEQDPGGAESRVPDRLAAALPLALGTDGIASAEVLRRLRAVLQATPSSSSWRFVNQLFGGREPAAIAAEILALVPNISMYTFKAAGAQILVEREVLQRMAEKVGLPGAEGCFTPGGSIANLVALLLARNAADPASRDGGAGALPLTVYTSAEAHYSVPKNAGIVGIGRHRVRAVAVREDGTLDPGALAAAIAADRDRGFVPALVNATAGTTVRGAFDPIRPIAAIARQHGAWLHVDGAFGGSVALSSTHRHLLDGSELADSFTWDPHKMMGVPLQCSALIVARPGALAGSLDETADYLFQADEEALNPGHRSIQCGRRNDALKLWAAWLRLGDRGWDQRLARQLGLARRAAERIAADPELELVEEPPSINVCFVVRGAPSDAVCDRLDRDGRLKIGHGVVRGTRAIRLVCVNPDLEDADLAAILGEIKAAGRELRRG